MRDLESLIIVGPPRAGKDTLLGNIGEEMSREVIVPQRWATRPYHSSDKKTEWTHKSHEEFKEGIDNGMISPWWTRSLDIGEDHEYYGFLSVHPDDPRLRIYSANYPILERSNLVRPNNHGTRAILARSAIVLVDALPKTLHARLTEIGPMSADERRARARKINQNPPPIHRPVIGFSTEGVEPHNGQKFFRQLVEDVLDGWRPIGYRVDRPEDLTAERPAAEATETRDERLG